MSTMMQENTKPLVSIVIAAYNVAQYIERCVRSCLTQSYHDIEIIVTNDGSTDATPSILNCLAAEDNRLTVVDTVNRGVVSARNTCLSHSVGDFIFILDGDDYIPSDAIELLVAKQMQTEADIVDGNFEYVDQSNRITANKNQYDFESLDSRHYILLLLQNKSLYQTFKLIRKSLWVDAAPVPEDLTTAEDAVAILSIARVAGLIVKLNRVVYYYYRREGSVTMLPTPRNIVDYDRAFRIISDTLQGDPIYKNELKKIQLTQLLKYVITVDSCKPNKCDFRQRIIDNYSLRLMNELHWSLSSKMAFSLALISPEFGNMFLRLLNKLITIRR